MKHWHEEMPFTADDSLAELIFTENSLFFDIETTGLHNDKNNITEIGAVKVVNGQIVDKWSTFVNPCQPIPENIVELTGITDSMVADAPKIEEILGEFFEFCKDCILVAHNAAFDIGFIKKAAERHNFEFNFCYLDTLMLARCMLNLIRLQNIFTLFLKIITVPWMTQRLRLMFLLR